MSARGYMRSYRVLTSVRQVTKGREKINFFTIPEYEQWIERTTDVHRWKAKYYKVWSPCHLLICPSLTLSLGSRYQQR